MAEQPTLESPRLILRPFVVADAPTVQRLAGERAVADTTMNVPHPYPDGAAEEWIATHRPAFDRGESAVFAMVLRQTGALVGAMGLVLRPDFERAELGYWVGQPYWGRGYCTEAARVVVAFGFCHMGLNRIYAWHLARNPASGRVMEKVGMAYEGCARQHVIKWDRHEDLVLRGLLRSEWKAQQPE